MAILSGEEWAAQQLQKEGTKYTYAVQQQPDEKIAEQKKEIYIYGVYAIVVLLLILIVIKLYQINGKK